MCRTHTQAGEKWWSVGPHKGPYILRRRLLSQFIAMMAAFRSRPVAPPPKKSINGEVGEGGAESHCGSIIPICVIPSVIPSHGRGGYHPVARFSVAVTAVASSRC